MEAHETSITPEQCRAGRALVNISQSKLAESANVGLSTVRNFEGGTVPTKLYLAAIRSALERAGVMFIDQAGNGPGVRLKARIE